jgi:Uncharacterized conserved protein
MNLEIKNIGKIGEASVDINGITVIAGANNTGKSTIGRTLFVIFNTLNDIEEKIRAERIGSITRTVGMIWRGILGDRGFEPRVIQEEAIDIVGNIDLFRGNIEELKKRVINAIAANLGEKAKEYITEDDLDSRISHIIEVLNIPNEEIFKAVLKKKFDAEFRGQINNIFADGKGEIKLQIQKTRMEIKINNNQVESIRDKIDLSTEAVYLDDPFVLDEPLYTRVLRSGVQYLDHRDHLRTKLFDTEKEANILDEIIVNNRFDKIYSKIMEVCSGNVVKNQRRGWFSYSNGNVDTDISISNLSTGLKTFAILKMLLINGIIEDNGTIILDEPEIHLHPEWQVLFAELIVLMHKEFNTHVLLNTHSPYFLNAIEVFSAKYEVSDKCKYYLATNEGENAYVKDVTNHVEEIYHKLARPFQELENERYQNV